MLAKCSRCSQTFQTDRYGEQFCPFCGAAVMIAAPAGGAPPSGGPPPPGAPPGAPSASGPQDQDAPVDNPAAHGGWFNAAMETWKKSVFDPNAFFNRIKPGPDTGGAIGYAMAILAVGGIFAGLVRLLEGKLQQAQMAQTMQQLSQLPGNVREPMMMLMKFAQPSVGMALATPILGMVAFFINAALLHVALMIVGGNKNGFTATIRAMAFAQGPALFNVVPFCGALAAGVWTLVLTVMGLAGVHRISVGRAIGAYALLIGVFCCLCCGGIAAMGALVGSAMHGAAGSGAFDVP